MRNLIRWILLILCIVLGLLYLNSAAFSLWAAGGPPTKVPDAWLNRSLINFSYSLSFILVGVLLFTSIKESFNYKKSKYLIACLIIVPITLGYPKLRELTLIDSCTDAGGSWSKKEFKCIK